MRAHGPARATPPARPVAGVAGGRPEHTAKGHVCRPPPPTRAVGPAAPQVALLGRHGTHKGYVRVKVPRAALRAWFPQLPAPVSLGFEVDGAAWQGGRRIASSVVG
jgi:hypothetical protein